MTLFEVRHVSVSIRRPPSQVYAFAADVLNLPKWATGLGDEIHEVDGAWTAEGPLGRVRVQMAAANDLGVLDHAVTLESGMTIHNPMRVVPNGDGSEVTFTLFRQPGMSEEKFAADAKWVAEDLERLRGLLEGPTG